MEGFSKLVEGSEYEKMLENMIDLKLEEGMDEQQILSELFGGMGIDIGQGQNQEFDPSNIKIDQKIFQEFQKHIDMKMLDPEFTK